MSRRRAALDHLSLESIPPQNGTHPGVWLERYMQSRQSGAEGEWINTVLSHDILDKRSFYKIFFGRWQKALEASGAVTEDIELKRFAIGLGEASVLDVGLTLHHTYGVPYLTGSAMKGLAAACARKYLGEHEKEVFEDEESETIGDPRWSRDGELYRYLFGSSDTGTGIIQFEDALPLPGKDQWKLHSEVMTPHHQEYYNGGKAPASAPADWDSPIPISFMSASGTFLMALRGPQEWCDVALHILRVGLQRDGIGAKTSSGLGRLEIIE